MDGYNSPYGIMDNYGQPGYADDPADESRQSLYGAAMPDIASQDTVGRPVHDRAPSQSGFGGYTPAKDAETLGGSEGNYGSKGGDPFSTPGGSGSGIYASAMPQTDAAQKYLDEELQWRRQHQPSMLRRILGTAASMYNPAIGQLISDPGGHEAKFRQNLPLYQAKSKLEQDELTKQATIAQKEEAEANSRAIRDQSQQSALDRQDTGTEIQPIQQMPSSATLQGPPPLTSPVAPDLMGPPAPEPQGPPVEPQGPPAIPPPSPLAGMYNPTVQTPGGSVPFDPKLSTPVVGGRPAPAGFERRRQTAQGLAQQKSEGEKALWIPTPAPILEKYPGAPPSMPKEVLDTYVRAIESNDRAAADMAMRKAIADQSDATRRDIAAQSNDTRKAIAANNPSNEKAAAANAIRSAFQASGGDWQKVIDAERSSPSQYGSDIVDHAQKMLALPPAVQKQITAADTTGDMAKKASDAIDAFTKAHPDLVGGVAEHPINAGKRKMETWAGTEPADIGDVDTALASVAALQPGQHNFRSIQALEEFKRNLGIDPRTGKPDGSRAWLINPEKAKQGLKAVAEFNQNLKENALKTAGRGGGANSGGAGGAPQKDQTRNYNGAIYKFDGTQWVKQ